MTDELEPQDAAEARMQAFLAKPEHKQKAHGKPEHVEDDVAAALEAEKHLGPPDWHVQGKSAPHGWKAVGDSFVEETQP